MVEKICGYSSPSSRFDPATLRKAGARGGKSKNGELDAPFHGEDDNGRFGMLMCFLFLGPSFRLARKIL